MNISSAQVDLISRWFSQIEKLAKFPTDIEDSFEIRQICKDAKEYIKRNIT